MRGEDVTGANQPPTGHPPGWYPDPWQAGRQQRYWDGNRWTRMTAPTRLVAPVAPARTSGRGRRDVRLFSISLATFLLAMLVVLYSVIRAQDVKRVSPTGDIEFYSSGGGVAFSTEEIKQRQQNMDDRLNELERMARESAQSSPPEIVPGLAGTWFGANGLRYEIRQFGSEAVIEEITVYGVTATGYGKVDVTGVTFSFQAIDGSTGTADLALVTNRQLEGTFGNDTFGTSVTAILTR